MKTKTVQPIVDPHLDLAENMTLFRRDLRKSVKEIRSIEDRTSRQVTVTLPELRLGLIVVAFATVTPGFLLSMLDRIFYPNWVGACWSWL